MKSKLKRTLEIILSVYCVLSLLFVLLSVGLIGWDRFDSRKTGEHRVLPDMLVAAETVDRYALIDKDNFEEQCTVLNEMIDFDIELSEQGYVYETAASKIVDFQCATLLRVFVSIWFSVHGGFARARYMALWRLAVL